MYEKKSPQTVSFKSEVDTFEKSPKIEVNESSSSKKSILNEELRNLFQILSPAQVREILRYDSESRTKARRAKQIDYAA